MGQCDYIGHADYFSSLLDEIATLATEAIANVEVPTP
jgi:hypothetical protein